jgi:bifunctional non-homologous end joining protein LigD
MIVQDESSRSDFTALRPAMFRQPERIVFMGFDLLHLNGKDWRRAPTVERREALQRLLGRHDPFHRVQYSDHVIGGGGAMFNVCDRMGLEGIVSKKVRSRYISGRSTQWLKVKCWAEDEFIVLGIEPGENGPAIARLARQTDEGLEYAGGAAITLGGAERDRFWSEAERLTTDKPGEGCPKSRKARWLTPEMRVRARFLKGSDKLRHATLSAVRT